MGNGLTIFSHLQDLKSSIELRLDASGGGKFWESKSGNLSCAKLDTWVSTGFSTQSGWFISWKTLLKWMIWGGTPNFGVNFVVFDRMEKIVQHLLFFFDC